MRKILIIGIGAGNPDYVTVQAIEAMNRADVFFIPNKGAEKADLQRLRLEICERFIKDRTYRLVTIDTPARDRNPADYRSTVEDWHARIERNYARALTEELPDGGCGAFLVWGDPTLYDSTLRVIDKLRARGFALEYDIIPGITAVQALAAQHRIALNRIGQPVLVTTGRKLAEGFPAGADSVVVMLDGEQTFRQFGDEELEIHWGAYLGTEDEILISGRLGDVMGEIEARRAEARERKGWIMDTYLLRKPGTD